MNAEIHAADSDESDEKARPHVNRATVFLKKGMQSKRRNAINGYMLAAFIEWPLGKLYDGSCTSGFIAGRSLAIQPFKASLAVLSTKNSK